MGRLRITVVFVLVAVLGGAIVGVLAGTVMAARTVLMNVIGFTSDSLLVGLYLGVIYGLVCALAGGVVGAIFAFASALGRSARLRTVFSGSFGIVLGVYLFLWAMRSYNQDLYYYEYSFINSLSGMRMFFAARTALITLIALATGYVAYRLSRRAPRRVVLGLALIVAVAGLVVNLQSRQPHQETTTMLPVVEHDSSIPKIVLIGWDGATREVMDRLLAEGKMPNTQQVIDRGTSASLKTIARTVSPEIWTTMYTGKAKHDHGIYGFDYYVVPGIKRPIVPPWRGLGITRVLRLALRYKWVDVIITNRSFRRATPVWSIMNLMGRSAGVISPLATWPAEKVEPFLICDTAGDVAEKVRRGAIDRQAFLSGEVYYPPDLDEWVPERILAEKRWRAAIGPDLYSKYRPDFFVIYFNQPDGAQHKRWKWMEPQYYTGVTQEDLERYGGAIEYEYMLADTVLGRILEVAGDSTTIMIMSDHGFSPAYRGKVHQAGHYHGPDGILIACGPAISFGATLEDPSVYDITPTLLALAGIPVADDMEGRVLEEMIRPDFLERHPIRTTPTYETQVHTTEFKRSQVEGELYEKLKALGYVGQ